MQTAYFSNLSVPHVVFLILAASLAACAPDSEASETSESALLQQGSAALAKISGTYTGAWTMRGVDATGASRVVSQWTDTVETGGPVVEHDRMYVSCVDRMVFVGANRTMEVTWKEGFLRRPDGSTGDRFFESSGQVAVEREIEPGVFTFAQTASAQELAQLGFINVVSGKHVSVKVVTSDGGVDTENVSRVTTVRWKTAAGDDRTTQMVTLEGWHRHTNGD